MNTPEKLPPHEALGPQFTPERLRVLQSIIFQARADKIAARTEADTNWNLSCDCFAWAWHALRVAAAAEHSQWLTVEGKPGALDAVFCIEGVPARFYRLDSPGQPQRTATVGTRESALQDEQQVELELDDARVTSSSEHASKPSEPVIRFAFAVNDDLTAASMSVQQIGEDGSILYDWPIREDESGILTFPVGARAEAIVLGPPRVELPEDKTAREAHEAQVASKRDEIRGA